MLSSVLTSERAIQVNIAIIKMFVQLKKYLAGHEEMRKKVEAMEEKYDEQFKIVFQVLKQLLTPEGKPAR